MKILITGGAGFIGTHLIHSLISDSHDVSILDNKINETVISNCKSINVPILDLDITNYNLVEKSLKGFDSIVHLAAKVSVSESLIHPEETHNVNVTGTLNILRACVKNNIKNIITASSAAVYGNSNNIPIHESSITSPISIYGSSKLAMEYYVKSFCLCYGLNAISLRFFNIYGEGQSAEYGGVIKKFLDKIVLNQPLEIIGDGTFTRDFISIDDVIQSIKKGLLNIKNKNGTVYNIGTGISTSINDVAKMMLQISNKDLSIIHLNSNVGDAKHSQASIKLAQEELGFIPQIKLKDGLTKLIQNSL